MAMVTPPPLPFHLSTPGTRRGGCRGRVRIGAASPDSITLRSHLLLYRHLVEDSRLMDHRTHTPFFPLPSFCLSLSSISLRDHLVLYRHHVEDGHPIVSDGHLPPPTYTPPPPPMSLHSHLVLYRHLVEDGRPIVGDGHIPIGTDEHLVHALGPQRRPEDVAHASRSQDIRLISAWGRGAGGRGAGGTGRDGEMRSGRG